MRKNVTLVLNLYHQFQKMNKNICVEKLTCMVSIFFISTKVSNFWLHGCVNRQQDMHSFFFGKDLGYVFMHGCVSKQQDMHSCSGFASFCEIRQLYLKYYCTYIILKIKEKKRIQVHYEYRGLCISRYKILLFYIKIYSNKPLKSKLVLAP